MPEVYNWQLGRMATYVYEEKASERAVYVRVQHEPLYRMPDMYDGPQVHLDVFEGSGVHVVEQC